jgi:hypothetical protein
MGQSLPAITALPATAARAATNLTVRLLASTVDALAAATGLPAEAAVAHAFGRGLRFLSGQEPLQATGEGEGGEVDQELLQVEADAALNGWRVLNRLQRYEALSARLDALEHEHRFLRQRLRPDLQEGEAIARMAALRRIFGSPRAKGDRASATETGQPAQPAPAPRATFSRLVAGEAEQTVRFTVPAAAVAEAEALIQQRGWAADAGGANWPLTFIAWGLAALRLEQAGAPEGRRHDLAAGGASSLRHAVHRAQARAAALRFAAFELGRSIQLLELRRSGYEAENRGMRLKLARQGRQGEQCGPDAPGQAARLRGLPPEDEAHPGRMGHTWTSGRDAGGR